MANTWVGIVTEKLRLSIPVTEKKYIPNDAQGWTFALHPCLFSIFLFDAYVAIHHSERRKQTMSEKIVQLNEEVIKGQIKELVRGG